MSGQARCDAGATNPTMTDRRSVLKAMSAAGLAGLASGAGCAGIGAEGGGHAGSRRDGLIAAENAKPGATDWQLTYTRVDPGTRYRSPWIEGYAGRASVGAGETIEFMVSTNPSGPFRIELFRMGYYGGAGARKVAELGPFEGRVQPDPPVGGERLRECAWEPCASVTIPEDWPSGVYLGRLSLVNDRWQSYLVFIVRDERPADFIFQCSDNTWQAYNRWPSNFALYDDGVSEWALKPGVSVSYDRPYGKYCQIIDAPQSQGSGEFLLWEFPLAFWLEREGHDVTYVSNTDVHSGAADLGRAKAFLSVGHDEYWSLEQYANVKAGIESGVNVAFLSGNTCCFVAPLMANSRGVPNRVFSRAGRYGGLSEAEKKNMGPFLIDGPNEALLIGARTTNPYNGSGDWIAARPEHWLFEGTGMKKGEGIPGLVGWEFHGEPATTLPGHQILAEGTAINGGGEKARWTATIYDGPRGNVVFNASTIWWAQGLSSPPGHMLPYSHHGRPHGPDARVERMTRNLLERFLKRD